MVTYDYIFSVIKSWRQKKEKNGKYELKSTRLKMYVGNIDRADVEDKKPGR
jgi:hypothetical protein